MKKIISKILGFSIAISIIFTSITNNTTPVYANTIEEVVFHNNLDSVTKDDIVLYLKQELINVEQEIQMCTDEEITKDKQKYKDILLSNLDKAYGIKDEDLKQSKSIMKKSKKDDIKTTYDTELQTFNVNSRSMRDVVVAGVLAAIVAGNSMGYELSAYLLNISLGINKNDRLCFV